MLAKTHTLLERLWLLLEEDPRQIWAELSAEEIVALMHVYYWPAVTRWLNAVEDAVEQQISVVAERMLKPQVVQEWQYDGAASVALRDRLAGLDWDYRTLKFSPDYSLFGKEALPYLRVLFLGDPGAMGVSRVNSSNVSSHDAYYGEGEEGKVKSLMSVLYVKLRPVVLTKPGKDEQFSFVIIEEAQATYVAYNYGSGDPKFLPPYIDRVVANLSDLPVFMARRVGVEGEPGVAEKQREHVYEPLARGLGLRSMSSMGERIAMEIGKLIAQKPHPAYKHFDGSPAMEKIFGVPGKTSTDLNRIWSWRITTDARGAAQGIPELIVPKEAMGIIGLNKSVRIGEMAANSDFIDAYIPIAPQSYGTVEHDKVSDVGYFLIDAPNDWLPKAWQLDSIRVGAATPNIAVNMNTLLIKQRVEGKYAGRIRAAAARSGK